MARTAIKVDRDRLLSAIRQAEKTATTQVAVKKVAAEIYNTDLGNNLKPITESVVGLRANEFGIEFKVKGKGVKVNKTRLVKAVKDVEASGPLANRTALYEAVAAKYNEGNGNAQNITPSVAGLRIADWGISVLTPKGKRGGGLAAARAAGTMGTRQSRAEKYANSPAAQAYIAALREKFPDPLP